MQRPRRLLPARRQPVNPVLAANARERDVDLEARAADAITGFTGSMPFVYLHAIWFACWFAFGVEKFPYGLLTMIVTLEAIFLTAFVMISQNRADARREALADQEWQLVQEEGKQNEQLLVMSRQILELTRNVHERVADGER